VNTEHTSKRQAGPPAADGVVAGQHDEEKMVFIDETLLVYRAIAAPPKFFPVGDTGLALYDAQDQLFWKSCFRPIPDLRMPDWRSMICFTCMAVSFTNGMEAPMHYQPA